MAPRKKAATPAKTTEYKLYITGRGIELKVFPVPQPIINNITPTTKKPERPIIGMPTKGGGVQKRPIKDGDEGWEEYQEELQTWEAEKDALQDDVALCLALREYDEYPGNGNIDLMDFPGYVRDLVDVGMLAFPTNVYSRKALWLRTKVVGQNDELEIGWIVSELSGVSEEVIQQMKDSFRNRLFGETSPILGTNSEGSTRSSQEDSEI